MEVNNQFFLAPDNGLLTPFIEDATHCCQVNNDDLFLKPISNTFHGRDILAPVAAALADGAKITELGSAISCSALTKLDFPTPQITETSITGQIVGFDHFGNAATNITGSQLYTFSSDHHFLEILVNETVVPMVSHYSQVSNQQPLAIINSMNVLEIAAKNDSARQKTQLILQEFNKNLEKNQLIAIKIAT